MTPTKNRDRENVVEQLGIVGSVHLVSGRQKRVVLEFREEFPKPGGGTNIVLTMADSLIVAMEEHRRSEKAHRLAQVG